MRAFTVGWFCLLGVSSLAGGIGQNVGRNEPVRCSALPAQRQTVLPQRGSAVYLCGLCRPAILGVCTLCTLWASDWVVLGADRAGFGMFPRDPSVCKGYSDGDIRHEASTMDERAAGYTAESPDCAVFHRAVLRTRRRRHARNCYLLNCGSAPMQSPAAPVCSC